MDAHVPQRPQVRRLKDKSFGDERPALQLAFFFARLVHVQNAYSPREQEISYTAAYRRIHHHDRKMPAFSHLSQDDLNRIAGYIMPSFPACVSDLGFLFGTRHGVPEFCEVAHGLWKSGMFSRLLVSGGRTGSSPLAEADLIAERLVRLGMPEAALILETAATNTGENVRFGRARVAEVMDLAAIRSVVVVGKICSTRRYLMTLQRHWPGLSLSVGPVNYFGVPAERWHEHEEFRARVLGEFDKIPRYLAEGFLEEIN